MHDYVHDTRLISNWDNPVTMSTIRYFLNYLVSSETGISPYEATFGSSAHTYNKLFEVSADFPANNALLTLLNDSIMVATQVLTEHINALDLKRTQSNIPQQYQHGDYVLYKLKSKKSKLQPIYSGPYKVLSHTNNDVLVQHPCKSDPQTFHMEDLYLFFGTTEQAIEASLRDDDQYFIESILDYRGDPTKRTTTSYLVKYMDDATHWVPYSQDINQTEAFETFCNTYPELNILLHSAANQDSYLSNLSKTKITSQAQNTYAYINLRAWGYEYYDSLNLPPFLHLVPCQLGKLVTRGNKIMLEYTVPLFNEPKRYLDPRTFIFFVYLFLPDFQHILIDEIMCKEKNW